MSSNSNMPKQRRLHTANLTWIERTPVSKLFDDVYFSRVDGIAETQYVFLEQNRLQERWQSNNKRRFTIAETGFGTGLNFLCTWKFWRQASMPEAHLHYISVEKYPLNREDLEKALSSYPTLMTFSHQLMAQYPAPVQGIHRLYFPEDRVHLTLLYGDATNMFTQLEATVDAWFLDGFAPAKNPAMWQPELFTEIARLSGYQTSFATFTAAGVVKRGLSDVGFKVEKHPGYGHKRDMLKGAYQIDSPSYPSTFAPDQKPWLRYPPIEFQHRTAAVIGAGLAGCQTARALAERGWKVAVFESKETVASQASGNPTGMTFVKLSTIDTPQNRYYQTAFLYACRRIRQLLQQHGIAEGSHWSLNGILQLAHNEKEQQDHQKVLEQHLWPEDWLEPLNQQQLAERFNIDTPFNGLWLKQGGWLNPATLCKALLEHDAIKTHVMTPIQQLRPGKAWQLAPETEHFDSVILACAFHSNQFDHTQYLPLRTVRGQITYVDATQYSRSHCHHAVNYEGYINPAYQGFHCVGATFNPNDTDPSERLEEHKQNLTQLQRALPNMANHLSADHQTLSGRVGFRCQTPDYLPMIGPVADTSDFSVDFSDLRKGFLKRQFPTPKYVPGLFVNTGHGSRGITSTALAAEIIAAYLNNEPYPVDRETLFALHPGRFLARNLIRRTPKKT